MDKKVEVYTSDTCSYCQLAKNYLKQHNVPFEEKNISDREHMQALMKMGHRGVPVIVVDGEQIVGFNKEKMNELLGL